MSKFERKFIVDPEGNAQEKKLSGEEKKAMFRADWSKRKVVTVKDDGTFAVEEKGETEGDDKFKLEKKDKA